MKPLFFSALIFSLSMSMSAAFAGPTATTATTTAKPGAPKSATAATPAKATIAQVQAPRAQKAYTMDSKEIQKLVEDNTIKLNTTSGGSGIRVSGYLETSYTVTAR